MNLAQALMITSPAHLVEALTQDARERVQTLAGALLAAEAPALLAGLRKALKEAQKELPALEQRDREAAAAQVEQAQKVAELTTKLRAIPDATATRREHRDAAAALKQAERELRDSEQDVRGRQRDLKTKRHACRVLEQKIAAVEGMPMSDPDPEVLAAVRGK